MSFTGSAYRLAAGDIQEGTESIRGWKPLERYVVQSGKDVPFVTFRQLGQHDAVMASVAGGDHIGVGDPINDPVGENGCRRANSGIDRAGGSITRWPSTGGDAGIWPATLRSTGQSYERT